MSKKTTIEEIRTEIMEGQKKVYHRGKSWEYCYGFFRDYKNLRNDKKLLDCAALHLGFFLASWGMFRGSSFLLQMDYKYYIPIINILIKPKYDNLWNADCWDIEKQDNNISILFDLTQELRQVMKEENCHNHKEPSDTLVTKIIMATMGCIPAYDRYFLAGLKEFLKEKKIKGSNFSKKSFKKLLKLSREDIVLNKIYKESIPTVVKGVKYPTMKILDLYFWILGFGK